MENLVSFLVDFNAVDNRGWVKTRRQFSGAVLGELQPGLVVQMRDYDDNACLGTVQEITDALVRLQPIWPTWHTGFRLTAFPVQPPHVGAMPVPSGFELVPAR